MASTTPHRTLPLFHAQITFDTITRERVAARVSAQSADVQYLDSAVEAKGLAITIIAEMAFAIDEELRSLWRERGDRSRHGPSPKT
jgi:hypothetical protein